MGAIKLHGPMTADGLGKALGISPVAVRQHLAALEAEGLVVTSIERRAVGRPVHRYTLTAHGDETFPRAYDALANSLMEELQYSQGEEAVDELFAKRRARQRATFQLRMEGKALGPRVRELAKIQSEQGYMASSQEEENGDYLLIEHNCAICEVARNHRSACKHELLLFQELIGDKATVEREKYMMDGDHTCTYRVRPTAAE